MLLELGLAAHKPSHEGAQYILVAKYHNPLAILVVGLTYHDPTFKRNQRMWSGSARQWSGRTRDLATRHLVDEGFLDPGRAYRAGGAMPGSISRIVGREKNMTVIGDDVWLTSKGRAEIQ